MAGVPDSEMMLTVRAELKVDDPGNPHNAILVQIYPTCLNMGVRYPLAGRSLEIGRGEHCDLRINHSSVSRRHARIQPGPEGYRLEDLDSTNGTFVNNVSVRDTPLTDGDSLRIGNCILRFLTGDNVEAEYHEEIYRLTIIDGLTELHNKRYLLEFLERELVRGARHHRPVSLLFLDLDHFKRVNDAHGHLCGDHTLRVVVERMRSVIRREELAARFGGEEFAVVLPETTIEQAAAIAERLRRLLESTPIEYDDAVFPVTVSIGVATSTQGDLKTTEELIRQADEALYQAKKEGRNCVRLYTRSQFAPAENIDKID